MMDWLLGNRVLEVGIGLCLLGGTAVTLGFRKASRTGDPASRQGSAFSGRLSYRNVIVTNPDFSGRRLQDLEIFERFGVTVTRVKHRGRVRLAEPKVRLHLGDILLMVGPCEELDELRTTLGTDSREDLRVSGSGFVKRHVTVTKIRALGRRLGAFHWLNRGDVKITRVARGGDEFVPTARLRLKLGDRLSIVGREDGIERAAEFFDRSGRRAQRRS